MATSSKKPPKLSDKEIFQNLEESQIDYSKHALERLVERNVLRSAANQMLKGKTGSRFREPSKDRFEKDFWKYMIKGKDLDGNELTIVLLIDEKPFVITVWPDEI